VHGERTVNGPAVPDSSWWRHRIIAAIEMVLGDITEQDVDAVVTAANEYWDTTAVSASHGQAGLGEGGDAR
jgi:hypothetical protein